MNQFTSEEQRQIAAIAEELKRLDIPNGQMEDLKALFQSSQGIQCKSDRLNRPQGPTVDTSRRIGSALKRSLGLDVRYGMSVVGRSGGRDRWVMQRSFRAALEQLRWFDSPTGDELRALDEELEGRLAVVRAASASEIAARLAAAETRTPVRITVSTVAFVRDEYVVHATLSRANGRCERCKTLAPFRRARDDTPYLEVHHIRRLSDGGKDALSNAEALCPNCHRQRHYGTSD